MGKGRVEEDDDHGMVPDEFSDGSQDDMEEFEANEEQFEVRPSVSSRGSIAKMGLDRVAAAKKQQNQPQNNQASNQRSNQLHNYGRPADNNQHHSPERDMDEESSVITEIVEEQIIEMEDDEEENQDQTGYSNDRDQRIQEYLNVDKDEYLNRNEYEDIADTHEQWSDHTPVNVNSQEIHYDKTQGVNNKYKDSSPIQEHAREEEMSTLIRTHYPNTNDKLHLVWERERLERKREEYARRHNPMTMHEYLKSPEPAFSTSTARGKLAENNFMKPPKRNTKFVESLKSSVPILSDHYKDSKTHSDAALPNSKVFHRAFDQFCTKKGTDLSSIFHQSELQNRMRNNSIINKNNAPPSHLSFNKITSRSLMGPTGESSRGVSRVENGSNRMFYTSQIF